MTKFEAVEFKKKPVSDVVSSLESMLNKARSGEITFIAYSLEYYDSKLEHGYCGDCRPRSILGTIEMLKEDFIYDRLGGQMIKYTGGDE